MVSLVDGPSTIAVKSDVILRKNAFYKEITPFGLKLLPELMKVSIQLCFQLTGYS